MITDAGTNPDSFTCTYDDMQLSQTNYDVDVEAVISRKKAKEQQRSCPSLITYK